MPNQSIGDQPDIRAGRARANPFRTTVCIGGPLNGQVKSFQCERFLWCEVDPELDVIREWTYRVVEFSAPPETFLLALADDVTEAMAMRVLLETFIGVQDRRRVAQDRGLDFESVARDIAAENRAIAELQRRSITSARRAAAEGRRVKEAQAAANVQTVSVDSHAIGGTLEYPAALDRDAPCDDCKNTRVYLPFTGPAIPCPTCRPSPVPAS